MPLSITKDLLHSLLLLLTIYSIYGRKKSEWDDLAAWVVDNNLFHYNVRWMIQIPRLFAGSWSASVRFISMMILLHAVYRKSGLLNNFQEMLDSMFASEYRLF